MSTRQQIFGLPGEKQPLLPDLALSCLAANGRVKYLFALLQLARDHQAFPVKQSPACPTADRDQRPQRVADARIPNASDWVMALRTAPEVPSNNTINCAEFP